MDDKQNKVFLSRMKSRRNELGLSYQGLADRTGLNKSTLQRYETGKIKSVPLSHLHTLAMGLQTSSEWLLGIFDDPDVDGRYIFASQLTPFDMKLLNNFHNADDEMKIAVCKLLDVPVNSCTSDGLERYARNMDWKGFD